MRLDNTRANGHTQIRCHLYKPYHPISVVKRAILFFFRRLSFPRPSTAFFPQELFTLFINPTPIRNHQKLAHPSSSMQADTANWLERATQLAKEPSAFTAAGGNAPWSSSFWACFSPFGLCCQAYWCPCIVFGKTHHRLHKDRDLAGYKTLNASVCSEFLSSSQLACILSSA